MICLLAHEQQVSKALEEANSFHEIFALVQTAVEKTLRESRAGLNLGIMELGNEKNKFLGAFYPAESNIIVLNNTPLRRIAETNPELFKPYLFHVILHEYLHSLGYLDENTVRSISYSVCSQMLGENHPATQMTIDIERFFPSLVYPYGLPANTQHMLLIEDLDRGMDYID
ncbi:MAG: hypothetical protein HY514_03500 [Candidatus Aenigmarchaeota archaeon]|nr:hypothetical protein [Candidatus Aenigmarchaeota archaeon]